MGHATTSNTGDGNTHGQGSGENIKPSITVNLRLLNLLY